MVTGSSTFWLIIAVLVIPAIVTRFVRRTYRSLPTHEIFVPDEPNPWLWLAVLIAVVFGFIRIVPLSPLLAIPAGIVAGLYLIFAIRFYWQVLTGSY